jgi:hypothetical protein
MFVACGKTPEVDDAYSTTPREETTTEEMMPLETQEPEKDQWRLQTKYMELRCSEIYKDVLRHQETVSDAVAVEIFSVISDDTVMELFRIYFGDEAVGTIAGYLNVDGFEIPVTYTICQYNEDEFEDENIRMLYLETMNCFNDIMEGVFADECFHAEKVEVQEESIVTKLSYWSITLPATMGCEEAEENGQYKVSFYGDVAGERIELYTIYLGDSGAETVLGVYDINGAKKILSVESYEIIPAEEWTDKDQEVAYSMLATINDVLQVIMSSEYFSEEIPQ